MEDVDDRLHCILHSPMNLTGRMSSHYGEILAIRGPVFGRHVSLTQAPEPVPVRGSVFGALLCAIIAQLQCGQEVYLSSGEAGTVICQ